MELLAFLKELKQNDSATYNKFGSNLLLVEQGKTSYLNVYLPDGQCFLKELNTLEKHWVEFLFRNDLPMIEISVASGGMAGGIA